MPFYQSGNIKIKHFVFFIFILIGASCENDLEEIKALTSKVDLPNITVKNLESKYSINGQTQVLLSSPLALRYTDPQKEYSVFPKGLSLTFYDKYMRVNSSLKADYGIYYDKKKYAQAKGNVILTNENGSVLRTEELFLNEKEEKIYSEKPVNITDKSGFEITGQGGFESNLDFTVYRFTDVSGKIIKENEDDFLNTKKDSEKKASDKREK